MKDEATHLLSRAWSACAAPPVTAWVGDTQGGLPSWWSMVDGGYGC